MSLLNRSILASAAALLAVACETENNDTIDRYKVVTRNNPHIIAVDTLGSFSVGNGEFAMTLDVTGMQTYTKAYSNGVPLGTMSQWGWHSFPNEGDYKLEETFKEYDFGRGHKEIYAAQSKVAGRAKDAANYFRVNPHRLHLGIVGFEMDERLEDLNGIDQTLDLWTGVLDSKFSRKESHQAQVRTVCHPDSDLVVFDVVANWSPAFKIRFPYPTGGHSDDGCRWDINKLHKTTLVAKAENRVILKRELDETVYYVYVQWFDSGRIVEKSENYWVLESEGDSQRFAVKYTATEPSIDEQLPDYNEVEIASAAKWKKYWTEGGMIDLATASTDKRAKELERRIVLSQYLLAIQCAGSTPPQETGLTYNSWFGKYHLEMIWWHQAQFALWGHPEMLEKTLRWYHEAYPIAKAIAERQGFDGCRWMKMTDPTGIEAPSNVGSFLIWQQPHLIYMAELVYRATKDRELLDRYGKLVEETADFMYSFATRNMEKNRFELKGCIPAQETLRSDETVNPPFELSYWHYAMQVAQEWRQRRGLDRCADWDELIEKLSPLAYNSDNLYLAAETAVDTYKDVRFTSDHMAVLGALGVLPGNELIKNDIMLNTFNWIWNNWNWNKTWGWDYPMTAMCAVRLGQAEEAVGALMMRKRTNTYLVNGHNFQDGRLRCYLPGNGGLLTAVALMTAGYDGCSKELPGWPEGFKVKYEGILPMP